MPLRLLKARNGRYRSDLRDIKGLSVYKDEADASPPKVTLPVKLEKECYLYEASAAAQLNAEVVAESPPCHSSLTPAGHVI